MLRLANALFLVTSTMLTKPPSEIMRRGLEELCGTVNVLDVIKKFPGWTQVWLYGGKDEAAFLMHSWCRKLWWGNRSLQCSGGLEKAYSHCKDSCQILSENPDLLFCLRSSVVTWQFYRSDDYLWNTKLGTRFYFGRKVVPVALDESEKGRTSVLFLCIDHWQFRILMYLYSPSMDEIKRWNHGSKSFINESGTRVVESTA